PDPQLQPIEILSCLAAWVAMAELPGERRQALDRGEAGELPQHVRELLCEQAEGHHAARADLEAGLPIEMHLAVPTETARMNVDGLDHRPPAADHGAVGPYHGALVDDDRHVGGGP